MDQNRKKEEGDGLGIINQIIPWGSPRAVVIADPEPNTQGTLGGSTEIIVLGRDSVHQGSGYSEMRISAQGRLLGSPW